MALKLLSDQVNEREITVVLRELDSIMKNNLPGDVVEFGCYVGTTSVFMLEKLRHSGRRLWLYDSFEGLPEKSPEDASSAGEQFKPGELRATRKQLEYNLRHFNNTSYVIKKSWFQDLTVDNIPSQIALAFLDGDYYQSIIDPLRLIWNNLTKGAVVIVDDYDNQALPGASRAVHAWAKTHGLEVRHEQGLAILKKP